MFKRILIVSLMLVFFTGFALSQESRQIVSISSDLTTIYTLGNAADEQRIDTEPTTAGAFFNNPVTGTRKNGYYTAANLYARFTPEPWLEGYFKFYAISRPGSFYLPLQMENLSNQTFALTLDAVYGRASVFEAIGFDWPVDLYLKAGKYKAQASQFGIISKYKTEQVLYMMNTKTDFTYEIEAALNNPFKLSLSAATNYMFNQSIQRTYDTDGANKHGNIVLNEYAPQFLIALRLQELMNIDAEILYGQNVSNAYSGHAVGGSLRYTVDLEAVKIPIGLSVAFHEKNIDMLGQSAIAEDLRWPNATNTLTTNEFRESLGVALGTGFQYKNELIKVEANLAGSFSNIKHFYRTDLNIVKLSLDTMFTLQEKYFVGAGTIIGSLTDAQWKTRDGITDENYDHTFTPLENMGYEVYAGINLGNTSKFVIGFNQNKGLSLNNMLEARHEGQMKFKQEGSNWKLDELAEAGGLYFKFFFKF